MDKNTSNSGAMMTVNGGQFLSKEQVYTVKCEDDTGVSRNISSSS